MGARTLATRTIHHGKVLRLDIDDVEEPGGVRAEREVVRHAGSVATLAVHEDGQVVLVSQYRHSVGASLWELPAGRKDKGEAAAQGAVRELEEEVGLTADRLEPLAVYYTTPGFCDEVMHLFRATGLRPVPPRPDEDERIEVRTLPLHEALALVRSGEIREGKTLVALLMESQRRADGTRENA